MDSSDALRSWHSSVLPLYGGLAETAANTLTNLLRSRGVDFLAVSHRPKDVDSFVEKARRKGYADPRSETTDLAGVRVITYIEADISRVSQLVAEAFTVHPEKSIDKSEGLGTDKIGYRSLHIVCDLGANRCRLPEYSRYTGLLFEIQVRTVLQHAWAEIEHDRGYKFAGILPAVLHRRLSLVAGMLEVADREFNAIADELDAYGNRVMDEARLGNLDFDINATSLPLYLEYKIRDIMPDIEFLGGRPLDVAIDELRNFGISSLADLDRILNPTFLELVTPDPEASTEVGLLRDAMLFEDMNRYFAEAWDMHWTRLDANTVKLLTTKYGEREVRTALSKLRIAVDEISGSSEDTDPSDV